MPDYKNVKIYTIRCKDNASLIYVGSTTQLLSQRWTDHKKGCNNENSSMYHSKLFEKIREIGLEKFYIELYEDFPCQNRAQLGKREGKIIREIGTLNKQITGRTTAEYHNEPENKAHKLEYMKEYNIKNRERRAEYIKEYRNSHLEELAQKSKEYRENNLEK